MMFNYQCMCFLCQLSSDVYASFRGVDKSAAVDPAESAVYLPESGQVARLLSTAQVPKSVIPRGTRFFVLSC